MPTFAEGEESKEEAVSAIVVGGEATGTKNMGEGIDEESAVQEDNGANEKSPDKNLGARGFEGGS